MISTINNEINFYNMDNKTVLDFLGISEPETLEVTMPGYKEWMMSDARKQMLLELKKKRALAKLVDDSVEESYQYPDLYKPKHQQLEFDF